MPLERSHDPLVWIDCEVRVPPALPPAPTANIKYQRC